MLPLRLLSHLFCLLLLVAVPSMASAEEGYDLWLRYKPAEADWKQRYGPAATSLIVETSSPTLLAAASELRHGVRSMLERDLSQGIQDGAIVLGTPRSSALIRSLNLPLRTVGAEGYVIRSARVGSSNVTVIAANSDIGVLYGTFALLRRMETRQPLSGLNVSDAPQLPLRLLNHWDNLDGFVERGYAGTSLWEWNKLPQVDERIIDYARANASIGINGTVLNNVNANAQILTPAYLTKVKALADAFRPYGIRVYLSARFSSPVDLGGLKTADPLDPQVRAWWKAKTNEIYRLIPDFGGFLVKANSEGQPGPQGYGRNHADGANMLADALARHGGTVFWRAFVYAMGPDQDRIRAAYDEFKPLDGKFRNNVIVQVKNGPLDFQPREPFSPLFGAMPKTKLAMEVQLTKEYLGYSDHIAYLGPLWSEVLRSRTARPRPSSEVRDSMVAMAGVANIGSDRNWTGSHFDQANWYAYGRLAWNPSLPPEAISAEWARMTWSNDPRLLAGVVPMMMRSREAVVDYMTPLGLTHLMGTGHHHGPAPWVADLSTPSWNPAYFHKADMQGIGFDRTANGSNAVAQYAPKIAQQFASLEQIPEDYLLWFHHVPWTHRLRSGDTLWAGLVKRYDRGVAEVQAMQAQWAAVKPLVDGERHREVAANLRAQQMEAMWWRDASIAYWQSLNKLPLPEGHPLPAHSLTYYKAIRFEDLPGDP